VTGRVQRGLCWLALAESLWQCWRQRRDAGAARQIEREHARMIEAAKVMW
jgi:hypothetical protein